MSKTINFTLIQKFKKIILLGCILLLAAFSCLSTADAYQLRGFQWPQPSTIFYVDIPGADDLWNNAFEGAMYEWSSASIFQFYIVKGSYSDPCSSSDSTNGVKFSSTDCGDAWGSTTLAICHLWYTASTIIEADIVFNSNKEWNVYWGPWMSEVNDFRRVAVHELGHALGLGHEDSGPVTIMETYAGDITVPQQDDIDGVAAMYESVCTYSISPSSSALTSSGGTSFVSVTALNSNCSWTTSESLDWVSLSSTSGTGSQTVIIAVAANTGAARTGSVIIAGQTYTISQSASCTYSISPSSGNFTDAGGSYFVSVMTSNSNCSWTTSESLGWVSLSPASGTGRQSVTVTVEANTGASRTGAITIADQTYTINQVSVCLTKTEVSQLFVSLFNRASEGNGNAYYQTPGVPEFENMTTTAAYMLTLQVVKDYFGPSFDDNQAFVELIFKNTLNRTPADGQAVIDGIAFWVGALEQGYSRGFMVAELIKAINDYGPGGLKYNPTDTGTIAAYNQFINRVKVSDYLADTHWETLPNYDVITRFGTVGGLNVTDDPATVIAAKAAVDAF